MCVDHFENVRRHFIHVGDRSDTESSYVSFPAERADVTVSSDVHVLADEYGSLCVRSVFL